MKEGLLIDRHVLTSMRINVMGFKVVVIDKTICFVTDILMPIILEALAIEVFTKARIRKITRLVSKIFVVFLYPLLLIAFFSSSSCPFGRKRL